MLFLTFFLCVVITGATRTRNNQVLGEHFTSANIASDNQNMDEKRNLFRRGEVPGHSTKDGKDHNDKPRIYQHEHRVIKRSLNTTELPKKPEIVFTPSPFILPRTFTIPPQQLICSGERSCQGRCTNDTEWRTQSKLACYCDPDCYEVFHDCCSDYVKYCGVQKPKYVPNMKYSWSCESVGRYNEDNCEVSQGLWMVARCPSDWFNEEIRKKCERPSDNLALGSIDLARYIPVVDNTNVTFRNYYCALCNSAATPIDFWPVDVLTSIIPPKSYNIDQQVEFLLANKADFPFGNGPSRPKATHARRYCVQNIISNCSNNETDNICSNGSTAIVSSFLANYKNVDCAFCQGAHVFLSCFPGPMLKGCTFLFPQTFTLTLNYVRMFNNEEEQGGILVTKDSCNENGMIYNSELQVCVRGFFASPVVTGYDKFLVYTWLRPDVFSEQFLFVENYFSNSIGDLLNTPSELITSINVSRLVGPSGLNSFVLVSFTITLTPKQSLLVSPYKANHRSSHDNLSNVLFFKKPFGLTVNGTKFTVIKTTSLQREKAGLPVCDAEKSCAGRCSPNRTEWRNDVKFVCYCDPDCYEVFHDCCSDYEQYCGVQKPKSVPTQKYHWTCERNGHFDLTYCSVSDGIWMVSKCDRSWPNDETRSKCESPVRSLAVWALDFGRNNPVISRDNITFRNAYCALCNGVEHVEPWPLKIETNVIPPENYNLSEKIRFLVRHRARFPNFDGTLEPKAHQPRRYCLDKVISSCPQNRPNNSCINGPVSLVSVRRFEHYKNIHCAICQQVTPAVCFPSDVRQVCFFLILQSFSLVFGVNGKTTSVRTFTVSIKQTVCTNRGMIYDNLLQLCRVDWIPPPKQNRQGRFYVVAWLLPEFSISEKLLNEDYHRMFVDHFNVSSFQILVTSATIIRVSRLHVVECTVILTPKQTLEDLSGNRGNSSEKSLFNFIYFKNPFLLALGNYSFTVEKTTSRPLTCVEPKAYTSDQYTLLDDDSVHVNSTNITLSAFEYYKENSQHGNITVCERYKPSACTSTHTVLSTSTFTVFDNLSIYRHDTSVLYHYGEYTILPDSSIAICDAVPDSEEPVETIRDHEVLGWITVVCFLLSIVCLIFLLVTYIKFRHLQTLSGKNLMTLALTLLLFACIWLIIGFDKVRTSSLCSAAAILAHYFLLASFSSMSVIAFHTCKTLARNSFALRSSVDEEGKLFRIYCAVVWIAPAVMVAICAVLDSQDIVYLGYRDSSICWVNEKDANIYFFAMPVGILLLFSAVAFVISALYLRKHRQNQATIQSSGEKRSHLSIYVTLATLMGFTCLFAVLAIIGEPATVYWFLFVICTSMQGVFLTFAFVVNTKTFKLYRRSTSKNNRISRFQDTSL